MYVMKLEMTSGEVRTITVGSWRDHAVERFKVVWKASEDNGMFEGDKLSLVDDHKGETIVEVTL